MIPAWGLGLDPEPTEAGLLDIFTEKATEATQSAMLAFIEAEKKKAIAEAKKAVVPVVIGVSLATAAASAALVAWLMTRR